MSFSLSGVASGMDTATIISELMKLERIPYTKLETRHKVYNNQMAVFRNINTKLSALRTAAADLQLKSTFELRSATSSDETVLKVSASETAVAGNYMIEVAQLATHHSMKTNQAFVKDAKDPQLSGKITIWNNGSSTEYTLEGDNNEEILNNLANQINSKDVGVKASIIETSPGEITLVLQSDKSGTANKIRLGTPGEGDEGLYISADTTGLTNALGLVEAQEAKDAKLKVNGIEITSSGNELSNVISGMSFALSKTGTVQVNVSRDVDKIAGKIEAFVNAYNDVINTIRSQTGKEAALQGDITLRSLQDQLSNLFNGRVGPAEQIKDEEEKVIVDVLDYQYLFEIGLEIDKGLTKGSDMTGTIRFDKDKFKQALAENPEAVYQLFAYNDSKNGAPGIAKRFTESLQVWTRSATGILAARIDGYNEQIKFVTKQMENMENRLALREQQLKKQFSAMEVALSSLQNQMSWLSSQIASMSAFNQQS